MKTMTKNKDPKMTRLTSPSGVTVSVGPRKADELRSIGYVEAKPSSTTEDQ